MKIQAIASCRVSTSEQKLSNSLNRQEESVIKAANELDVEVIKWWSGDVSSKAGTNVNRKDLKEMQEFCKQHKQVKYLIVDEPDRFMRSIDEAFYFEVLFRQLGVTLWYACDPALNTGDLMSKMLKFSKYFPAEGGNVERQVKSISGHEKAIREGRYTFPPKPGYTKGTEPGVHVPHSITFGPLQKAFREVLTGLYTPTEACKRLKDTKFSKVYKRWDMDKFRHIAVDPYYAGILKVDRQVKATNPNGRHQAMLTVKEHEELVRMFAGTKKIRGPKKQFNPAFPIAKMLLHEECGGTFTGSNTHNGFYRKTATGVKPRKIHYYPRYRCRGCGKSYARDKVHDCLTQQLSSLRYTGNQQKEFTEALEVVWRQKQQDKLREVETLHKRLEELEYEKTKLIRALADAELDIRADVKAEIDKVKSNIEQTNNKISQLQDIENDLPEFVNFGLNYTDELIEDWWDLDRDERFRCQQLLFPGGIMFNSAEKVSTPQISPLYTLETNKKDLRFSRKSLMVELVGIAPTSDELSS